MGIFEDFLDPIGFIEDLFYDLGETLIIILVVYAFLMAGLGIVLPIVLNSKAASEGKKSKGCAYLLLFFWGGLAGHRFYLGKAGSAILWIFTSGYCFVGYFIDLFMLSGMVDTYNRNAESQALIRQNNQMIQQNIAAQNAMMNQIQQNQYNNAYPNNSAYQNSDPNPQQYQAQMNAALPKLVGISGQYAGISLDIDTSGIILGRDPSFSNLVFTNTEFSRKHCTVHTLRGQVFITDFSSNGTFLGTGERLSKGEPRQLLPGDSFYLVDGREMFRIDY